MRTITKDLLKKIDEYIENNREQIIADLRTLVEIPSVRSKSMGNAPFGEACAKALKEAFYLFEREGFAGRISSGTEYAIAEYGDSEKTIGLFAHSDVVSADGEWLFGEPFKLTQKDGFFIGRGCNDDKSGIIQMLYSGKIIRDLMLPIKSKLMFCIGSCEESGMEDIEVFVRNEKMPDVSIVPDGEYPYYSGEKSWVKIMLESVEKLDSIKEISGGKSFNVILDNVNVEYNDGFKTTFKGIGGHAAYPEGSVNALKIFAEASVDNISLSENEKSIFNNVLEILKDNYGTGLGIAHNDETFGKLTYTNGIVKTVDGKVVISLDIRHGISIDGNQIIRQIKERIRDKWNIVTYSVSSGYIIDEKTPAAIALRDTYRELSENKTIVGKMCSGGTYARHLKNAFPVGTVMYSHSSGHNFPKGHGGVHSPDEAMHINGFLESIKTLVCMIMELDAVL